MDEEEVGRHHNQLINELLSGTNLEMEKTDTCKSIGPPSMNKTQGEQEFTIANNKSSSMQWSPIKLVDHKRSLDASREEEGTPYQSDTDMEDGEISEDEISEDNNKRGYMAPLENMEEEVAPRSVLLEGSPARQQEVAPQPEATKEHQAADYYENMLQTTPRSGNGVPKTEELGLQTVQTEVKRAPSKDGADMSKTNMKVRGASSFKEKAEQKQGPCRTLEARGTREEEIMKAGRRGGKVGSRSKEPNDHNRG